MNLKRKNNFDDFQDDFDGNESMYNGDNEKSIIPHNTLGLPVCIDLNTYTNGLNQKFDGVSASGRISTIKMYDIMMRKKNIPSFENPSCFNYCYGFYQGDNNDEKNILKNVKFYGVSLVDFQIKHFSTNLTITATPTGLMTIPVPNPNIFSIGDNVTPAIVTKNDSGKNLEVGKFTLKPLNKSKDFLEFFAELISKKGENEWLNMSNNEKNSIEYLKKLIKYIKLLGFFEHRFEYNNTKENKEQLLIDLEKEMTEIKEGYKKFKHKIPDKIFKENDEVFQEYKISFLQNEKEEKVKVGGNFLETFLFMSINEIRNLYEQNAKENIGQVVGKRTNGIDVYFRKT